MGYIRIKRPELKNANSNGYIYEHRAVWIDHYGEIPTGSVIHHIDGDKTNNHISNLRLVSSNGKHRSQYHVTRTYEGKRIAPFDLFDYAFIRAHLPLDRI